MTPTLQLTRIVAAPREQVFQAWTDPVELAEWFWPQPEIQIDARPGGRYLFRDHKYGLAVAGEILEVSPPERLVFTWQWEGEGTVSEVTVEFHDHADGTEIRLTHRGVPEAEVEAHTVGWNSCLDRLSDLQGVIPS